MSQGRPHLRHARRQPIRLAVASLAITTLLAACGAPGSGGSGALSDPAAPSASVTTSTSAAPSPSIAATRSLADVLGLVDVPAHPERIVADSHFALAHLWTLGIVPVGVAIPVDIDPGYIGDGVENVPNLVADDGWTLDVEAVLAADADLIVAVGADYNLENCERYKAAMPTFCYTDGWVDEAEITSTINEIAVAVDRDGAAADAIAAYRERKAALAERVDATDLTGKRIGLVRFGGEGWVGLRVEDLGATLLQELGMQVPAWEGELVDGYLQLSLETLDELNAADILLITLDDGVDPATVPALKSQTWQLLDPVKNDQAHVVSAWNSADFPGLETMLDDIERALVIPAETGS